MFPTCILAIENDEQRLLAEELFIKYRKKMYSIALRRVKDPNDAEDAVSEAFFHVVDHIEKFEDAESKASVGLLSIITDRCAIRIFNQRTKAEVSADENAADESECDINVETAVVTKEQIEMLMLNHQVLKELIMRLKLILQ